MAAARVQNKSVNFDFTLSNEKSSCDPLFIDREQSDRNLNYFLKTEFLWFCPKESEKNCKNEAKKKLFWKTLVCQSGGEREKNICVSFLLPGTLLLSSGSETKSNRFNIRIRFRILRRVREVEKKCARFVTRQKKKEKSEKKSASADENTFDKKKNFASPFDSQVRESKRFFTWITLLFLFPQPKTIKNVKFHTNCSKKNRNSIYF